MGEASDLERGLWPSEKPLGGHYSVVEVLPKMLALLKKYDVHVTYFVEAWNLLVYPDNISAISQAGHEIAWHGWRHETWHQLGIEAVKESFSRSFGPPGLAGYREYVEKFDKKEKKEKIDGKAGGIYRGFRPPGGVVLDAYTMHWCCENYKMDYISPAADYPALVKTKTVPNWKQSIAVLPFRWTVVDATYYMDNSNFRSLRKSKGIDSGRPATPEELAQSFIEQIDYAIEEGNFLSPIFHPFLTTSPGRMEALETVIKYLARKRDEGIIWLARCQDIAAHLYQHPESVREHPTYDETRMFN